MISKRLVIVFAASGVLVLSGAAYAAPTVQLLQFEPTPLSPGVPEFSWTGPGGQYTEGAGAIGNGDGNLPIASQTPGGLEVDVTNAIASIPAPAGSGEVVDANGTHFYDVTMTVQGLTDTGAYVFLNPTLNEAIQTLASGTFTMTATNGLLLLTGTFVNNSITIPLSSTSSGYQSGAVNYTGGLILTAALSSSLGGAGGAAISMTAAAPIGITYNAALATGPLLATSATVSAFNTDATGVFSTTTVVSAPEPASIGIASLAAASLMARRKRAA